MSISIVDDDLQHALEPGTPTTAARLATLRELRAAGLECTVFIAPILSLLSDRPHQLETLVRSLAEAGATGVLYTELSLPPRIRPGFFAWLRRERPDVVEDYERIYAGPIAHARYRAWLAEQMTALLRRFGLPQPGAATADRFALQGRRGHPDTAPGDPAPTLF